MSDPIATAAEVFDWMQTPAGAARDDELMSTCIAGITPVVQRARPEFWTTPIAPALPEYVPDADAKLAGIMLAAKLWRRRNSPAGIETFGDSITYVARFDPEVEMLLRVGRHRRPAVG